MTAPTAGRDGTAVVVGASIAGLLPARVLGAAVVDTPWQMSAGGTARLPGYRSPVSRRTRWSTRT